MEEIDELTHVVQRARGERDNLLRGLREMQETLRKNAAEVRFTEKWVKVSGNEVKSPTNVCVKNAGHD